MGQTRTLKEMLNSGKIVRVIEFHDLPSAIVAYHSHFDALWASSLTMSAVHGLPDDEVSFPFPMRLEAIKNVIEIGRNPESRIYGSSPLAEVIEDINKDIKRIHKTGKGNKPIIYDGDSASVVDIEYIVKKLEESGVAMVIIEDKTGPKMNSLNPNRTAIQDDPYRFAEKIYRGTKARKDDSFLVGARIESLTTRKGEETIEQAMEDALYRAGIYARAGADAILIHSKAGSPDEVLEFARRYREIYSNSSLVRPLIAVPTAYPQITERELQENGFSMVIYANQLLRAAVKAWQDTAKKLISISK